MKVGLIDVPQFVQENMIQIIILNFLQIPLQIPFVPLRFPIAAPWIIVPNDHLAGFWAPKHFHIFRKGVHDDAIISSLRLNTVPFIPFRHSRQNDGLDILGITGGKLPKH